jgi:alpha-beta hydrolase superfamily lysophospholipase
MTNYTRSETFFKGFDHSKLFLQTWSCADAVGTIFFTHGHGEHSDSYHRLISGLDQIKDAKKWNFVGWDMRGFGRSDGSRGYAKDFNDYVLDYDLFIKEALKIDFVKNKKIVLFCHSMGGLVQICGLLENKYPEQFTQIIGQILSAPLTGVAVSVPAWKDVGANIFNQLLPKLALGTGLNNEMLTRDPEIIREFERDTYRHLKMSSGVYLGMKDSFQKIFSEAGEITLPTQLIMSDSDPVNSSPEALRFFDLLGSTKKSLKIFDGAKHELINDTCRADVCKTISEFLQQLGGA